MNQHYDVIITGAGPAGLACAKGLKDSGLNVLIAEKNKTIGSKICAGGLTGQANGFYIPENLCRSFAKQKIVICGRNYQINLVNPIRTISRYDLAQYQLQQIEGSENISILTNTSIRKIEDNRVTTDDDKSFTFRYLVGADGSTSTIRKHLGLKTKRHIGFYYTVPELTNELSWYIDPGKMKTAYIWEFPHQKHTNVGIYFDPGVLKPKSARHCLQEHLRNRGYTQNQQAFRSAAVNYDYRGYRFGNIFLAGDAAGLASKGTGEGISFALVSGREIARLIIDPAHKTEEFRKILKIKNRQELLFKFYETFPPHQALLFRTFTKLMKYKGIQKMYGS